MDIGKHYKSGPTFSTPEPAQFYQHVMARNPVCSWADKTIALSVVHSAEGLWGGVGYTEAIVGRIWCLVEERRAVGCTELTSVSMITMTGGEPSG